MWCQKPWSKFLLKYSVRPELENSSSLLCPWPWGRSWGGADREGLTLPSPWRGEESRDSSVGTLGVKGSVSDMHEVPEKASGEGTESHTRIQVGEEDTLIF